MAHFSHVMKTLKAKYCPWGNLDTTHSRWSERSSSPWEDPYDTWCYPLLDHTKSQSGGGGELVNYPHQKKDMVEIPTKTISILKFFSWSSLDAKSRGIVVTTKGGGKCQTYTTFIWRHPSLLSSVPKTSYYTLRPLASIQTPKEENDEMKGLLTKWWGRKYY